MAHLDPSSIDVPTLAALAGGAANEFLLGRMRRGVPGLRVSHGYVVQRLVDGETTIGRLARDLGVTQQGASKLVAELQALGLVDRRVDAADSRVRRLALSAKGRRLLERGRRERRRLEVALEAQVGARELAAARRVLVALLGEVGGLARVRSRKVRLPKA